MTRLRARRSRAEDGSILAITLLFLFLFALLVPSLLSQTSASFQTTVGLRTEHNQVYAAQGSIYSAIQSMRSSTTAGAVGTCGSAVATPPVNGYSTRVSCTPASNSGSTATNRPQYDLLALPPSTDAANEGVSDSPTNGAGGGGAVIYVGGSVASNGYIQRVGNSNAGSFTIDGSAVASTAGGCVGKNVISTPACTTTSTAFTDPGYALGISHAPAAAASPVCLTNAAEFFPGTYNAAPTISGCNKTWWFTPGTYYFDFTSTGSSHVWTVTQTVVGGTPNPAKYDPNATTVAAPSMPGACKGELDVAPNTGVEWVFGADTQLSVSTGKIELCPTPSSGSQQIAIYGYGAGGAASPGAVGPSAMLPTSNTTSGNVTFTTPANAYKLNETPAATSTATLGSNKNATLKISGFPALPTGASLEAATLTIQHRESNANVQLSASVTATGITTQTYPQAASGCTAATNPTGQLCQTTTGMKADTFDLTPQLSITPGALTSLAVSFTAQTAASKSGVETYDGIELDVTYAPTGDLRRQSGCVALAQSISSSSTCDFINNTSATGQMYVNGTVYAPLGRLDITTGTADTVQLNRGVIARDIIAEIKPGNGSSHSFGFGKPNRYAYLTGQVQVNGTWVDRAKALVAFDDETFGSPGSSVSILQWMALR